MGEKKTTQNKTDVLARGAEFFPSIERVSACALPAVRGSWEREARSPAALPGRSRVRCRELGAAGAAELGAGGCVCVRAPCGTRGNVPKGPAGERAQAE